MRWELERGPGCEADPVNRGASGRRASGSVDGKPGTWHVLPESFVQAASDELQFGCHSHGGKSPTGIEFIIISLKE